MDHFRNYTKWANWRDRVIFDTHMSFPENNFVLQRQYAESQVDVVWSICRWTLYVCLWVNYQKVIMSVSL